MHTVNDHVMLGPNPVKAYARRSCRAWLVSQV